MRALLPLLTAAMLAAAAAPGIVRADNEDRKVTLNLRDSPLRQAIELLFSGSGLQYSIAPNVPDVPINMNVRDINVQAALRLVVKQASIAAPGLTYSRDGDVFVVKVG